MSIRAGIIGCGAIAECHVDGYKQHDVEIVALADINRKNAEKLASTLSTAKIFDDYRTMLESGEVEAISICTPPVAHEEVAVMAIENGKHVLVEKPLAHTVESAKRIMAAAENSNVVLMPAFRHRFLPSVQKIKEIIDKGEIGDPVCFYNIFTGDVPDMANKWFTKKAIAGGGTMLDTSSHSVDLFRFLIGEVVEQKAVMHTHLEGTDVEDASIISVKSQEGAIGAMVASWVAGDGQAIIDIIGRSGRVVYDYSKGEQVRLKTQDEDEWQTIPVVMSGGFSEEIGNFLAVIEGRQKPFCTGRDGLRAVEIIHASY